MAPTSLKAWPLACWALLAGTWAAAAPPPDADPGGLPALGGAPVKLVAASSELDLPTKSGSFTDITITQGTLKVQADRARGNYPVDFSNSHWTFEGHVRMDAEQRGSLRADQSVVEFKDTHIARATATGKPAEFEQQRTDSQPPAHGHADEIVYDVTNGTLRLSGNAWLAEGQDEISSSEITYNIRTQHVQAATTPGSGQVHITVTPPAKSQPNGQP
jgi:lipopolysaccharide transport protein LptA